MAKGGGGTKDVGSALAAGRAYVDDHRNWHNARHAVKTLHTLEAAEITETLTGDAATHWAAPHRANACGLVRGATQVAAGELHPLAPPRASSQPGSANLACATPCCGSYVGKRVKSITANPSAHTLRVLLHVIISASVVQQRIFCATGYALMRARLRATRGAAPPRVPKLTGRY